MGGGHVKLLPGDAAPAAAPAASTEALPLPNYDDLTIASLRARLRNLSADQLAQLVDYEKSHANRADVVQMFERRITKLARANAGLTGSECRCTARDVPSIGEPAAGGESRPGARRGASRLARRAAGWTAPRWPTTDTGHGGCGCRAKCADCRTGVVG